MDSWEWLFMQPEGQNLDRKGCYDYSSGRPKPIAPKDLARKVAEDLVAMANSEGGVVAVGIEDDGRLSGVPASYNLADFRRKLEQLVMPRLHFHIEEVDLRGMRVWVAEVDWSTEVHQLSDGRCLYRRNDQSLPFPVEDVAAIKRGRLTRFYEQQVVPQASLRDIDADLVEDLARRAGLNLSLEQTLMHYRLAVAENGRVQLRLAALLLFAKDPLLWHPRCGIDFAVWRGTRRQTGAQFLVNIDPYIASQDIRDLVRKGIVRLQKPRGREYVVTTAASRGEKPESLVRLMPLLEKQGYVTNKDIREVFGVTLNKANRIAKRLVDTGWLSALGDRRGRRYILKE